MNAKKTLCVAAAFALLVTGGGAGCLGQTLREYADRAGVLVGAAVEPRLFSEPEYASTLAREFNMLSAENAMKWGAIRPDRATFNFEPGDRIVAFAREHRMKVRGHCLLWSEYNPGWLVRGGFTPEQLAGLLREHITKVMQHYRGRVFAWDVVNEVFLADGTVEPSVWYDQPGIGLKGKGTAYVEQALRWAREADPDALLFYNDYDTEGINPKSDAVYAMAKDFRARGVPLDGVGIQAHITDLEARDLATIEANIARLVALGLQVHITEMDVGLPLDAGGRLADAAALARQAEIYRQVASACLRQKGCTAFQTWGFTDKYTWIPGFTKGAKGMPLPFDRLYAGKPAYDALLEAFRRRAHEVRPAGARVKTASGTVEGTGAQSSGVRVFKGIPFARPPTGELRWREPQPVKSWTGVRRATKFGPRCMQAPVFGDMGFRSDGMSEDCLYLNVWTPAKTGRERLPVLVYFYGGGFVAGDGSEPRYDGESMAAKGVVSVTVNYRLGAFGFLAHPELTKESPRRASGNYGLLDQHAALRWVRQNIAAFGGDPRRVTIAGESAGSVSVSAQMASPLSKDLVAGAIGESGAITGTLPAVPLAQAEQAGARFAAELGATSLAALRALSTQQIFEPATKGGFASVGRFPITVDGYFFKEDPAATYAAGRQARVPLLVGWNSEEMTWLSLLRGQEPTTENYAKVVRELYGEHADEVLKLYPASTREEVIQSATDLAGDRFIAYSTWKWAELHGRTGGQPVYRYFYARPRPAMRPEQGNAAPGLAGGVVRGPNAPPPMPPARGAVHSAEIEYALGNLSSNNVYAWTPDDYKVSRVMQEYFANFIKKGDPNGPGLPAWPATGGGGADAAQLMRLDVESRAEPDRYRARYLFLDRFFTKR